MSSAPVGELTTSGLLADMRGSGVWSPTGRYLAKVWSLATGNVLWP